MRLLLEPVPIWFGIALLYALYNIDLYVQVSDTTGDAMKNYSLHTKKIISKNLLQTIVFYFKFSQVIWLSFFYK